MQLFISNYIHVHKNISINNQEILNQLKTVLRYRVGDLFYIQKPIYANDLTDGDIKINRYKIKITSRDKNKLDGEIVWEEEIAIDYDNKTVVVAMPNKREKLELICQKLTEIGISNIIIYFSKRSVIKQINTNKIARIEKIIKESVEQSYGVILPSLSWEDKLTFGKEDLILYQWWEQFDIKHMWDLQHIVSIIIWPEWWRDDSELELFQSSWSRLISIWSTVLRTETACIVWWWILKNL